MLHELIHAEVIRLLVSEGDDNSIPDDESNFPSLWNAFVENQKNGQHEYMAQFYVTLMTDALTKYCNNANIVASNELITAVCWAGLHNTTVWIELPEATKVHYRSLIASQLTNSICN